MSEEVKDENVSQSAKDIITAIKEADSFGPFGKSEPSDAKNWVQWQCLNVDSVHLHYEIIAKKDTIYAEFHIEPKQNVSEEIIKAFEENIADATASLDGITKYHEWQARGFAIRWGDGVDVQNKKPDTVKEKLSGQMEALHTAIDGVVSQHLIKYIFKDLIDNSDSSGEKFLKAFNDRIYKFYNENKKDKKGSEKASYLLVRLLEQVHEQYPQWRLPFGEKSAKRIFNQDNVKDLFGENPKEKATILIEKFIEKIKNEKFLISPFSFWSIFFSHNNEFATQQRPSVLSSLLDALRGDESNRKNIVQSLIDLRVAKARLLSKQKKGEEKDDLTIEGWTQLVDNLSKFAQICWELFKEVMTDNPNKDTINGYIQDIKTKEKNGENVNLGCDGVGKEAVPNILPFIRPDLQFYFDQNGNVTNIIRSKEMEIENTLKLLENSKQIILTGAPGTGKTYHATEVAENMIKNARTAEEKAKITEEAKQTEEYIKAGTDEKKAKIIEKYKEKLTEAEKELFKKVQFHPGYDYSDFIIGLKPEVKDGQEVKSGQVTFDWKDGVFKEFSDKAKADVKNAKPYIFIIDEINRADLSRVFGEVFSLLEEDYRYPNKGKGITLPNKEDFILPRNLYIIGTMNDIDRSVESMDFALRRRFSWKEVTAEESAHIIDAEDKDGNFKIANVNNRAALQRAMNELNIYIGGEEEAKKKEKLKIKEQPVSLNLGGEYKLGGAYFLNFAKYQDDKSKDQSAAFESLWNNHIVIILNEYLRGRSNREQILSALKGVYDTAWKVDGKNNDGEKDKKKDDTGNATADSTPEQSNEEQQ